VLIGSVTMTFYLSTSKWGHAAPASFLPIFIFLCASQLSVMHRTDKLTNRQTTVIDALCPRPMATETMKKALREMQTLRAGQKFPPCRRPLSRGHGTAKI